ncbi:MOSC domain-containing protein [Rhizobium mesosinicum]|uniref:MOSC domain-containing protein n=2 Tax=Rhizobium mesosinicum TaxID=335017 RepID=A0ABS7GLZ6_9HYPH|nr:MOSC domain-containing protein [Rhizobium mesosinicum]
MQGNIESLFYYPIKGLSPQGIPGVDLQVAEGFPNDRVFGFARYDSGFDPVNPQPLPKDRFLVLVKEDRLAGLQTYLDPSTRQLTMKIQGHTAFEGNLHQSADVSAAVDFFATMFDLGVQQRPIFAYAGVHRFTDVSVVSKELMNAVSLINLASVRDLEAKVGRAVDPLRFRANIYFDGWPPFSELDLVGTEFSIGTARLRIVRKTRRCAATEVNPVSALRDLPVPRLLMQHYSHADLGVYAEVLEAGSVRSGDVIKV